MKIRWVKSAISVGPPCRGLSLFSKRGFGIGKFIKAAAVAEGADEVGGFGEGVAVAEHVGSVEVDVGEEERHRATLGDLLGFGQVFRSEVVLTADEVVERGGEQATGMVIHVSCFAEAVDGVGEMRQVERRLREWIQ